MEVHRRCCLTPARRGARFSKHSRLDIPAMGPSVVVVPDNDPELPRRAANRLADTLWFDRFVTTA